MGPARRRFDHTKVHRWFRHPARTVQERAGAAQPHSSMTRAIWRFLRSRDLLDGLSRAWVRVRAARRRLSRPCHHRSPASERRLQQPPLARQGALPAVRRISGDLVARLSPMPGVVDGNCLLMLQRRRRGTSGQRGPNSLFAKGRAPSCLCIGRCICVWPPFFLGTEQDPHRTRPGTAHDPSRTRGDPTEAKEIT